MREFLEFVIVGAVAHNARLGWIVTFADNAMARIEVVVLDTGHIEQEMR